MEWLKNLLDPEGIEKRRQVKSLYRDLDQVIERLCSGPEALAKGRTYSFLLPQPYSPSSIRAVYPGFPAVEEMNVGLEDYKDGISVTLFSDWKSYAYSLSYTASVEYHRKSHQSKGESHRDIDFSDEALRLNMIIEMLGVAELNKYRAEEIRDPATLIPV